MEDFERKVLAYLRKITDHLIAIEDFISRIYRNSMQNKTPRK